MLPNFLIVTKDGVDYGEGSDDAVLSSRDQYQKVWSHVYRIWYKVGGGTLRRCPTL